MDTSARIRTALPVALLGAIILFASISAEASHSWGTYHWARIANPFTLKLGDNVSGMWDASLSTASSDWSADPSILFPGAGIVKVLTTTIVAGNGIKNCKATSGTVQVCNNKYGNNGWLGVAQIWASGSHITQGTVRLNDTYFNTPSYNTAAWRNLVMCQEIGHTFGLDHQDEIFGNPNLGTCMDYTDDPSTNQHPNQHDYWQLASIYSHGDSFTTVSSVSASKPGASGAAQSEDFENATEWGKEVRISKDGRNSIYERDLGNGRKVFTFVIWADSTRSGK